MKKRNSLKRLTALVLSLLMLLSSSALAAVNMDGAVPFVTEPIRRAPSFSVSLTRKPTAGSSGRKSIPA